MSILIRPTKIFLLLFIAATTSAYGQFSLTGQFRTRAEYRDGQGAPLSKGQAAAVFISQRSRLNALFNTKRLKTGLSLQDVRVWGQDVSTINRTTSVEHNSLMLHQAWAELLLSDTTQKTHSLSLKLGRQELVYDDQRLIGNLDWLQQGRRHDAALLKYESGGWSFHMAAAFNQNKENTSGTVYNSTAPANYAGNTNGGVMYKSMQFVHTTKKLGKGNASLLFFSDQFSRFRMETIDNLPAKTYMGGAWARFTTGVYYTNTIERLSLTGAAYYQFGRNYNGQQVRAYLLSFSPQYQLGKWTTAAGMDYTSGGTQGNTSKAFDPLYGTPHKFWGLMDYFYAGSGFGRNGLADYYVKLKMKSSSRFNIGADLHHFTSAVSVAGDDGITRRQLGQELDLVAGYDLSTWVNIEAGYSRFFTTSLLTAPALKNVPNAKSSANWAYVMINIKPDFFGK